MTSKHSGKTAQMTERVHVAGNMRLTGKIGQGATHILLMVALLFVTTDMARGETGKEIFRPAELSPHTSGTVIDVGAKAPDFTLSAVNEGKVRLSDYAGHTVLLSFIQVHDAAQADQAQATRAQLTFIKSMQHQYGANGLKIMLVDEPYHPNQADTPEETLINFKYDHELTAIPLLKDNMSDDVAGKYGVTLLPTTLLISKDGIVCQRWEHVALTAQLALAIEAQVGVSYLRQQDPSVVLHADENLQKDRWATSTQTIFPGLEAARPLSDSLWMVDGGRSWPQGEQHPVRFLVFADQPLILRLKIIRAENNHPIMVSESRMEPLPEDESTTLLANMPGMQAKVYSMVSTLSIARSGAYLIQATVSSSSGRDVLQAGTAKITVK